ncbi:50S ribosomal protein L30e [Candidatus Burarchaeum australiense]|nr:50S ribosomal protein L30e [Candidatus Burarchaeum australiense]
MDVEKNLRMAIESGKVEFGTRSGVRSAAKAKLVLVSSNCPSAIRKKVEEQCAKSGAALVTYKGTSVELGAVCGKPFPISIFTVLDAGSSGVLEMGKPPAAKAEAPAEEKEEAEGAGEAAAA